MVLVFFFFFHFSLLSLFVLVAQRHLLTSYWTWALCLSTPFSGGRLLFHGREIDGERGEHTALEKGTGSHQSHPPDDRLNERQGVLHCTVLPVQNGMISCCPSFLVLSLSLSFLFFFFCRFSFVVFLILHRRCRHQLITHAPSSSLQNRIRFFPCMCQDRHSHHRRAHLISPFNFFFYSSFLFFTFLAARSLKENIRQAPWRGKYSTGFPISDGLWGYYVAIER